MLLQCTSQLFPSWRKTVRSLEIGIESIKSLFSQIKCTKNKLENANTHCRISCVSFASSSRWHRMSEPPGGGASDEQGRREAIGLAVLNPEPCKVQIVTKVNIVLPFLKSLVSPQSPSTLKPSKFTSFTDCRRGYRADGVLRTSILTWITWRGNLLKCLSLSGMFRYSLV